jgi:pimeloyl-ACP methyl ester carboxylesterase
MKVHDIFNASSIHGRSIVRMLVLMCLVFTAISCKATPVHGGSVSIQDQASAKVSGSSDELSKSLLELVSNTTIAGDKVLAAVELGSGDKALAVYAASPKEPRGTALFIHGYMASVGSSDSAIRTLLNDGWLVVALDLPGHGKSGGERHDIGDFSEYGAAVRLVADALSSAPGPLAIVGHSLGAAAILSSLESMAARPEVMVLIAPLLRIRAHGWASFGATLAKPFTRTLPGGTPVGWFYAYKDWARGDLSTALKATLDQGTRVGFVLCGSDEAVSNAAAIRLSERAPGSRLMILGDMSHWEIDKDEPDPRLWEAVLAFMGDRTGEAP